MGTTAAAVAQALADAGIERVFGLPGGEILVLIDELRRAGIDFVLMRHESNAGIAAAVYGKLRRQPGVVLTTLGPGAANLMLPLSSSLLDQEPLLAISAQVPDDWPATHTHQLLPLLETYGPIARYVGRIPVSKLVCGWKVPSSLPRRIETACDCGKPSSIQRKSFATARSCRPSPLRSSMATEFGTPPVERSSGASKDPSPIPSSTDIEPGGHLGYV